MRKGVVKKRKRRSARRLKQLGALGMAIYLAYGLYCLWATPFWRWDGELRVVGNRLVSRQAILAKLDLPENTPLYRIDPQHIARQLAGVPAIARVGVRRWLFPARLELVVLERQALLGVEGPGGPYWMDQEGVVFAAPSGAVKPRFPIRVQSGLKPGGRLAAKDRDGLFALLMAWPKQASGRIDMRKAGDARVMVGGMAVRLGGLSDVPAKFAMLDQLRPLAKPYANRLEYIDLRFVESPSFKLKTGSVQAKRPAAAPASSPAPAAAATAKPTASPSAKPSGSPSP